MNFEQAVNILLVDDRPENLLALESILGNLGHQLVMAHSGQAALKALLRQDFAVILLDVQMPGLDGFETAELIRGRERSQHTPIIFLTALDRSDARVFKGYSVGAVDFLFKPFMPEVLRSKVAVFVDLFRKTQEIQRHAEELELRVRERTSELTVANRTLRAEINERRRAEDALRYQLDLNRAITNNTAEALFMLDAEGRTTFMNPAAEQMFGWRQAELLGKVLHDHIHHRHPDGRTFPKAECPLGEVFRSGEALRNHEDLFVHRDGTYIPVYCSNVPIHVDGKVTGAVVSVNDITQRKRAEEERERLYREAQEAIQARDEFLSIASHELKTPLTALQLQLQMLLRSASKNGGAKLTPERLLQKLHLADQQTDRLAGLINDLLDVARIRTGRIEIRLEEVDLTEVVRDVLARFEEQITQAGCSVWLRAEAPLLAHWDRSRLEQVFTNLLSNAIKYGPGKPIEIWVNGDATTAELTVQDHGIGIAPEHLERIFVRFERAVSANHYGGLGLGLYIVRQIVEALGGTIRVTSELGHGSTFTVALPRSVAVAEAEIR
ncbi:MAG: ATP-binding protein [Chloroflexota bacterium]|nr:ATP-binding protein [Chloroflexota bacterium]